MSGSRHLKRRWHNYERVEANNRVSYRRRVSVIIRTLIIVALLASGQTQTDILTALRSIQNQVTSLQEYKNAEINTQMRVWIDSATATGFIGWGFHCGEDSLKTAIGPRPATLDVLIDGIPAGAPIFFTGSREDVREVYTPYCTPKGVPVDPGIWGLLNLTNYPSGAHTIQIRLSDPRGAVESSNIVQVIK